MLRKISLIHEAREAHVQEMLASEGFECVPQLAVSEENHDGAIALQHAGEGAEERHRIFPRDELRREHECDLIARDIELRAHDVALAWLEAAGVREPFVVDGPRQ